MRTGSPNTYWLLCGIVCGHFGLLDQCLWCSFVGSWTLQKTLRGADIVLVPVTDWVGGLPAGGFNKSS